MNDRPQDHAWHGVRYVRVFLCGIILLAGLGTQACYAVDDVSVMPPVAPPVDSVESVPTVADIATFLNAHFRIGLRDASKISKAVVDAADHNSVSPVLLLAVIAVESNFNRFAVSVAGARGLMQILPSQHKNRVSRFSDLNDPDTNVAIGSSILHEYIESSDGDVNDALLRYSGGSINYSRRVDKRMQMIKTAFTARR